MAVLLMMNPTDACGRAGLNTVVNGATFGVVANHCAQGPIFSFGHELGHMYGCMHNREEPERNPFFSYGYGKLYKPGFRTLMRY
jgi:hypothetical protein